MNTEPNIDKLQESEALQDLLKRHQDLQSCYHSGGVIKRLQEVVNTYHDHATDALLVARNFRDRMLVDLRAWSLVLTMVGNASTHKEKDARLRGAIELLESSIQKLEREKFDIALGQRPSFDDPFRSDYPTRHFIDRIRCLETELKDADAALKSKDEELLKFRSVSATATTIPGVDEPETLNNRFD